MRWLFLSVTIWIATGFVNYALAKPPLCLLESGPGCVNLSDIIIPNVMKVSARRLILDHCGQSSVRYDHGTSDRYGHPLMHAYCGTDWLQKRLVKSGLAYVYRVTPHHEPDLESLLESERHARWTEQKLWSYRSFQVIDSSRLERQLKKYRHSFRFISGQVYQVEQKMKHLYINLGPDWKEDTTIAIKSPFLKQFDRTWLDQLVGKKILVKGWVESYHGPLLLISDPSHIQIQS